ncbi:MAG: D-2-hydroxyacid dehydrogenase family protein [Nitrospinota bacterium]|nr:MAG: D-2-hydroxyacid dehydrogenase family protein [Nitrospinota bacterium]
MLCKPLQRCEKRPSNLFIRPFWPGSRERIPRPRPARPCTVSVTTPKKKEKRIMRIVFPDGAGCVQKPEDLEPLQRIGPVDFYQGPPQDKAELIARLREAEAVFLDYSVMDAEVLQHCPKLRFICFLGIGYASCIDVEEATRRGIVITYTPDYGATSVAEHTLGMILALTRHICAAAHSFRQGRWEPGQFQGVELRGKILGIVGLGPIGQEMARLGAGIGMQLLAWTRNPSPERAQYGLTFVSLEELFSRSDIVTLHLSYNQETHGLVSRALLNRLKPDAYFINTARAKIVDNAALAELLQSRRIAGAALDVHEEEPPRGEYIFRSLPNVLLTPHIGYNTREAGTNMLRIAIATLEAYLRGEQLHVVNAPG